MNKLASFLTGALLLGACAAPSKPPVMPTPGPQPAPVPKLEKTHGEIHQDSAGAWFVSYKTIQMIIDPAESSDTSTADYLLFTESPRALPKARKNIKIMLPLPAVVTLQSQGFTQVKAVSTGQRLYLKKDEAFLFASAVTSADKKNGYLLEFDNGRNVYISGRLSDLEALRELVFSLRDDGKEIYVAILSADSDARAAEAIALLQPQFSFYDPDGKSPDRKRMEETLSTQLYEGVFSILKRDQSIPF